jgi:hypothetical protein
LTGAFLSISTIENEAVAKPAESQPHRRLRAFAVGTVAGLFLGGIGVAGLLSLRHSELRSLPRNWPLLVIAVAALGGIGGLVGLGLVVRRQAVTQGRLLRRHILRTLLHKEMLRHLANRGGIVMIILLVVMSLMLSLGKSTSQGPLLGGNVQQCFLLYERGDPALSDTGNPSLRGWIRHLRQQKPAEWDDSMFRVRRFDEMDTDAEKNIILGNAGSIRIRSNDKDAEGRWKFKVELWYPGESSTVLSEYETWFWRETERYFSPQPQIEEVKKRTIGSADLRSALAPVPIFFALFFACVYLLPSMTCEERERGVLLAQALSPASPLEILISKFLFYSVLGIGLGVLLAGIYRPSVLLQPFLWLALIAVSLGSVSVGLTIATLAKTQRLASVGAMCYLLMVALFLFTMQQINLPVVPWLFLEYHTPEMLHAVLADSLTTWHWVHLLFTALLAIGWATVATILFRQRGWQ